ncbi:MAG: DUF3488 and transglutaminase-like domain-containing protein [Acidobacteriota bacterium]
MNRSRSSPRPEQASPWTCESAFQLSVCLLFLGGFLTLAVSEGTGMWMVAPVMLAVWRAWRQPPRALSSRAQYGWFALLALFTGFDFLVTGSLVDTTIHLLLATGLLKLFTRRNDKDYLFLFFISFSFLLVASANTISALFLVSLLAYVFLAIFSLILFESRRSYQQSGSNGFSFKAYLQLAIAATLLIALIAVPIFVLIPRTRMGLFNSDQMSARQLSGFSDEVQLGTIGRIIANTSLVMRVQLDRPLDEVPVDLKWRGIALDRYDGKSWRTTLARQGNLSYSDQYQGILVPHSHRTSEGLLAQQVSLKVDSPVIFGAWQMVMLRGRLRRRQISYDANYNLFQARPRASSYTVYSDYQPRPNRLPSVQSGPLPDEIRATYLQTPASTHPDIDDLAREVTLDRSTDLSRALAIEQHLRSSFGYSLENRPALSPDPLYDFLFVTKAGHCEYFATAQAVLMRRLGIPSRVVNGFRRGEYNPWSGSFTVRQSDAHSWVEGFFPGAGWIEFDPTPASARPSSFYLVRLAQQLLDALDQFWSQIVTFDQVKQWGLFRSVFLELRQAWQKIRSVPSQLQEQDWRSGWESLEWEDLARSPLAYGLLIAALAGWLLYRCRRFLKLFIKRLLRKKGAEIAPQYYLEMLYILERRGLRRRPSETPAEFARRAGSQIRSQLPARITELYYRNRFGRHPLGPAHLTEIYGGLKTLRSLRALRRA